MGALACTPTGRDDASALPQLRLGLLPGEKLLAFGHWPGEDASLTVYASGAVDYRAHGRVRREFRFSDASFNDVLKLMRLFEEPAFGEARAPAASPVAKLYVPVRDHSVDVLDGSGSVAIAEAYAVVDGLRVEAAETGIDPFSKLAHRVVSPLLVHTTRRPEEGHVQEVTVFDNGALEVRRMPFGTTTAEAWAASGCVQSGTLFELRQHVADVDAEVPVPPSRSIPPLEHELITTRTRREFRAARSEPTRALLDALARIVSSVEPSSPSG